MGRAAEDKTAGKGQPGQERPEPGSQIRQTGMVSQNKKQTTGRPEHHRKDRTARTEQAGWDTMAVGIGHLGKDSLDRTVWTGQPDRSAWSGEPGWDGT
jgi:hypothetical protein